MYELLLTANFESKLRLAETRLKFIVCLEKHFNVKKYTSYTFDLIENEMTEFTIIVILGESHAILHTYPEKGTVYINLCSCKSTSEGINLSFIGEEICKELKLKIVDSRLVPRG